MVALELPPELGQEILPALAKFVYDIDTDDGLYSLQIRKMRGKRGARATWAVAPVDARDSRNAAPTAPATPLGSPTVKKAEASSSE